MQCNCENLTCKVCQGNGCSHQAGDTRVMYIGAICDACAKYTPECFKLPKEHTDPNPCVDTSCLNR